MNCSKFIDIFMVFVDTSFNLQSLELKVKSDSRRPIIDHHLLAPKYMLAHFLDHLPSARTTDRHWFAPTNSLVSLNATKSVPVQLCRSCAPEWSVADRARLPCHYGGSEEESLSPWALWWWGWDHRAVCTLPADSLCYCAAVGAGLLLLPGNPHLTWHRPSPALPPLTSCPHMYLVAIVIERVQLKHCVSHNCEF